MSSSAFMFTILVTILSLLGDVKCQQPSILHSGCTKPSDCSRGECCVIGMMRFSIPRCMKVGDFGDYCMMNGESRNFTLFFPNGLSMELSDVHTLFCPCNADRGLECQQGRCTPADSSPEDDDTDYNYVL